MNLYCVVGVLVYIFRVHTLCQRCECVCQTCVGLHLLALLRCELALLRDVFESLVEVNVACCLIQNAASGVEFCLHACQHVVYGREVNDGLVKLLALLGVCKSLVVCSLAYAHALCCDAQTCAVHKCHYIFDKTHACASAKLSLGVLVYKLAGR